MAVTAAPDLPLDFDLDGAGAGVATVLLPEAFAGDFAGALSGVLAGTLEGALVGAFAGALAGTGFFAGVGFLAGAGFFAGGAFLEAAGFLGAGAFLTGFEGLETFTGAFLAGAGFFGAGFGAGFGTGFFTGLEGSFFADDFFAAAGFLGAGAFLAGFVLEIERAELLEEDLDLVFKRLSFKSFTLGQKADEDRPYEFLGQGFVFEFFGAPREAGWNHRRGS